MGANYTKKKHPVKLVYFEQFDRIDEAFVREKQVQGWSHAKKKALIENRPSALHELAECRNESHYRNAASRLRSTTGLQQRSVNGFKGNRSLSGNSRSSSEAEMTDHEPKIQSKKKPRITRHD